MIILSGTGDLVTPAAAIFENRGDQLTAGDGNPIDTWVDNIGTNDFLSTGSERPTQRNNTLNSMPTAEFTAAEKMTLTTSPSATTNLSFLAVVKVPGGGNYTVLGSDSGPQVRINVNKIQFLHGGVLLMGTSLSSVTANTWWTIGVTYDGSTVKFYLNGVADGTDSVSHTFSNPVKYIGVRDSTSERFAGNMAHVAFYDTALGTSDMTNGGGGKTDALRTLWAHY